MLFVIQTGGMGAVALIFANHVFELAGRRVTDFRAALLASIALALLTLVNCIGVRAGSVTQNIFMILKLVAIADLVAVGFTLSGPVRNEGTLLLISSSTLLQSLSSFCAEMIQVHSSYDASNTSLGY